MSRIIPKQKCDERDPESKESQILDGLIGYAASHFAAQKKWSRTDAIEFVVAAIDRGSLRFVHFSNEAGHWFNMTKYTSKGYQTYGPPLFVPASNESDEQVKE